MDHVQVPLRNRAGEIVAHALVSSTDAEMVTRHRWCLSTDGYARRRKRDGQFVKLHRELLGLSLHDGLEGDHINGDRLDCRRENLRIVTRAQNCQNVRSHRDSTSPHRGVHWSDRTQKWHAEAYVNGRKHWLGYFDDEEDAAEAAERFRAEHMTHAVAR